MLRNLVNSILYMQVAEQKGGTTRVARRRGLCHVLSLGIFTLVLSHLAEYFIFKIESTFILVLVLLLFQLLAVLLLTLHSLEFTEQVEDRCTKRSQIRSLTGGKYPFLVF